MRQRQDLPGAYPVQIPPFILITQEPDSSASALSARFKHKQRSSNRRVQRLCLSLHGDNNVVVRTFRHFVSKPVSFIADQERTACPVIFLVICELPLQMSRIDFDPGFFQPADRAPMVERTTFGL